MKIEDLDRLKEIVDKDLKLTDDNCVQKSLDHPTLFHKYLGLFIGEFKVLKTLELEKNKLYKELYHSFKFEGQYNLESRNEIESYVFGTPQWCDFMKRYNDQSIVVKYLEETLDCVKKMSFTVKNILEYKKFLSGL